MSIKTILVTGGAGFIGSALVRFLLAESKHTVVNVDKLTYAGNQESLSNIAGNPRYHFERTDICDADILERHFNRYQPDIVMHLAAESHVDRSIDGPAEFMQTNIMGTYTLLETARKYWLALGAEKSKNFRFHHISTDEVFGALDEEGYFTESTPYDPSSPYSASKAASDHLVRAWHKTYQLPVIVSNCSNNYGPFQFPEKLIPLMILNAMEGKPLPVYGDGQQIRDWLYVDDHVRALYTVIMKGKVGGTYNIGGENEKTNLSVVKTICAILDELLPDHPAGILHYEELISHVVDRPGHDQRYAIDASKIKLELQWSPDESFASGIRKTVQWYLQNRDWWRRVQDGSYRGERLGLETGN